ncbi:MULTISPECIES: circadian clock KaiB family protein [Thiorhodovibrio]|uniref:circadian clock KaiB family protein n=1 Tax=Thiorhodovibrio TaxID=61593 RepID=UPI0019137700|nr:MULTISPECIES: circadian clock KaiB family protein [Thiorhodovibrio]MBK5969527.1 hypothetical protein [Thiorhodovibrio winogradskyi]WPL14284.1 Circadian clock protein KaiB [Thiorhodovibrio litoralis]
MIKLKLYVTGMTPGSRALIAQLEELIGTLDDNFDLEVLDIFEHPNEAYDDLVQITPTLVRSLPPPVTQIIGDLSNRERILAGLALNSTAA